MRERLFDLLLAMFGFKNSKLFAFWLEGLSPITRISFHSKNLLLFTVCFEDKRPRLMPDTSKLKLSFVSLHFTKCFFGESWLRSLGHSNYDS